MKSHGAKTTRKLSSDDDDEGSENDFQEIQAEKLKSKEKKNSMETSLDSDDDGSCDQFVGKINIKISKNKITLQKSKNNEENDSANSNELIESDEEDKNGSRESLSKSKSATKVKQILGSDEENETTASGSESDCEASPAEKENNEMKSDNEQKSDVKEENSEESDNSEEKPLLSIVKEEKLLGKGLEENKEHKGKAHNPTDSESDNDTLQQKQTTNKSKCFMSESDDELLIRTKTEKSPEKISKKNDKCKTKPQPVSDSDDEPLKAKKSVQKNKKFQKKVESETKASKVQINGKSEEMKKRRKLSKSEDETSEDDCKPLKKKNKVSFPEKKKIQKKKSMQVKKANVNKSRHLTKSEHDTSDSEDDLPLVNINRKELCSKPSSEMECSSGDDDENGSNQKKIEEGKKRLENEESPCDSENDKPLRKKHIRTPTSGKSSDSSIRNAEKSEGSACESDEDDQPLKKKFVQATQKSFSDSENELGNASVKEEEVNDSSDFAETKRKVNGTKKSEKKNSENGGDLSLEENDPAESKGKKKSTNDKADDCDSRIERLKRYIRTAGLRVQYSKVLDGYKSRKAKMNRLLEVLTEAGLKGKPTLESCKKLKKKREKQQELAELDVGNIIVTEAGRSRRKVASTLPSRIRSPIINDAQPAKKIFSRLKGIVDSDDSD